MLSAVQELRRFSRSSLLAGGTGSLGREPTARNIVEQAYGRWLGFLNCNHILDRSIRERATAARLTAFVVGLRDRVAPASAGMMVGALLRILIVLEPDQDWTGLARLYNRLKQTAAPSRDKLSCMVPASELLDLGIALMETCDRGLTAIYKATRYRDGLLIALLISAPMRLKNLASLVIGQHLVFDGHDYQVKLPAAETKTGRPYVAAVPPELTTYIDRWLQVYRPVPLMAAATRATVHAEKHLWVDRNGRPMSSRAIHAQITLRTRQAFGNAIWPHLFRDCAVTLHGALAGILGLAAKAKGPLGESDPVVECTELVAGAHNHRQFVLSPVLV